MDDDNSKNLDKAEFNKAMQDFALGFTVQQCSALFDYFDVDRSGSIDYDEFIRAIRGPMNNTRNRQLQLLTRSWTRMVTAGSISTISEVPTVPRSTQTSSPERRPRTIS
jgi:hypothetical protein